MFSRAKPSEQGQRCHKLVNDNSTLTFLYTQFTYDHCERSLEISFDPPNIIGCYFQNNKNHELLIPITPTFSPIKFMISG
jgi:hypothetical protein